MPVERSRTVRTPEGRTFVIFSGLNLEVRAASGGRWSDGRGQEHSAPPAERSGQTDICALPANELAEFGNRELGFVWQIHSLLAEFTAHENVMMPLLIRGQSQEQAGAVSLARLKEVGLRNRATHRAGELSGGEQQGVVLARTLVGDPSVLLADEPTGSLDFRTGEMMMALLEDLHRSRKLTSIHVAHNLNFARCADRVVALERGKLIPTSSSSGPCSDSERGRNHA